ncbi:CAP domain-containing protein [Paraburkholderia sp. RL17-337-BIB-A]|uniref:CAP domain-containing protein n=1 Tax=Paraburkholderia sp. RL17-337-BIB-A TaxID=3031636 RepID=UPI0038BC2DA7
MKYVLRSFSKIRLAFVVLASSVMIAACGGGGGGGNSSPSTNNSNPNSSNSTPATLMQPAATPQTVMASGDPTADGIAFMNAVRQNVGYTTQLTTDATLASASKNHTVYLVDNQATGHNETAGLPGYTGQTPFTRAPSASGEVVVSGDPLAFPTTLSPVETIFNAPYHRLLMLDNFASMGVASTTGTSTGGTPWEAFNIDFGGGITPANASQLVVYPYPGQTNVPTQWFAAEEPDPFASQTKYDNTFVGYPVTVQGILSAKLSSLNIVLTDSGGNNVLCQQQTPDNDNNLTNGAMCIPFSPLKPNATYTVHLTGVLASDLAQASPINLTWTYTTGHVTLSNEMGVVPQPRKLPQF